MESDVKSSLLNSDIRCRIPIKYLEIESYADAELQGKIQTIRNMRSSTYPTGATIAQLLNVLADSFLKRGKRTLPETAVEVVSEVEGQIETASVSAENIMPPEDGDSECEVLSYQATSRISLPC